MPHTTFVSHGQNREDVVLWRALGSITNGRYVEVGGNDPLLYSISRGFYDRGWSGLVVEPEPEYAARQRADRPRDVLVEAAITSQPGEVVLQRFSGTGLSTLDVSIGQRHEGAGHERDEISVAGRRLDDVLAETGFDAQEVHFMVVDVEGLEADVLATVDLTKWRPWVLVIEATLPNSEEQTHDAWEPSVLASGYTFCLFDGLSRFYVADEHVELADRLGHSACVFDEFVDAGHLALMEESERLRNQIVRWRRAALETWATASAEAHMNAAQQARQAMTRADNLRQKLRTVRGRNARLRERVADLEREVAVLRSRQVARRAARAVIRRAR